MVWEWGVHATSWWGSEGQKAKQPSSEDRWGGAMYLCLPLTYVIYVNQFLSDPSLGSGTAWQPLSAGIISPCDSMVVDACSPSVSSCPEWWTPASVTDPQQEAQCRPQLPPQCIHQKGWAGRKDSPLCLTTGLCLPRLRELTCSQRSTLPSTLLLKSPRGGISLSAWSIAFIWSRVKRPEPTSDSLAYFFPFALPCLTSPQEQKGYLKTKTKNGVPLILLPGPASCLALRINACICYTGEELKESSKYKLYMLNKRLRKFTNPPFLHIIWLSSPFLCRHIKYKAFSSSRPQERRLRPPPRFPHNWKCMKNIAR